MLHREVFVVMILSTTFFPSVAELVITSHNTETKLGETTYFNCSTSLEDRAIFWYHGDKYVYTTAGILDPYRGRFEIDWNAPNKSFNLIIHSVEPGDAGKYICVDDDGLGSRHSAELVVLGSDPACESNMQPDGVVGPNIFNIPQDNVRITCTVIYHGNIPPKMEWMRAGDTGTITGSVTSNITSHLLIYTLELKGDISLDNVSYVCQTTRSTQNQYKCKSDTIKVLYFIGGNITEENVVTGEKITCISKNYSFSCISQWYYDNISCPLSCDETITTHLLGEYLCTLKCHFRGRDFYYQTMRVVVVEATTHTNPPKTARVAASVVIPLVIVILVVLIAVYEVRKNKRKYAQMIKSNKQEMLLEYLITQKAHIKSSESEINDDNVDKIAEEEMDLLYKIRGKEKTSFKGTIAGIAILSDELFIVRQLSSKLEVYDFNDFNHSRKLQKLKDLVSAADICSCRKDTCLYIMDEKTLRKPKEVLRINAEGKLLMKWLTKDSGCGFLSVTAEGNVMITVQDKSMLLEYSQNGHLLLCVNLSGCKNPRHAIKFDCERYIVSHGTFNDPLHRVCLVNKKGNIEKSFGRNSGAAENQLNMPFYLAVGSTGFVILADSFNNRLLLFNSRMELKTKIVPKYKQRFTFPRRLHLDENRLVVVISAGNPGKIEKDRIERESNEFQTNTDEGDIEAIQEGYIQEADIQEGAMQEGDIQGNILKGNILKGEIHVQEVDMQEENIGLREGNIQVGYIQEADIQEGDIREADIQEADMQRDIQEGDIQEGDIQEIDESQKIEEDCKIVVFDIQPILSKYCND